MPQRPEPWVRDALDGLTLSFEPFADVIEEALPLTRRHFEGLGLPYAFEPDWTGMLLAAAQGMLGLVTARNGEGRIVGYCTGVVSFLQCARGVRELMVTTIYLEPDYRGSLRVFRQMLRMMEDFGRERGCVRLLMMPLGRLRRGIGAAICRMGWELSVNPIYEKALT